MPGQNTGWECPVCHKGCAPHADACGHCAKAAAPVIDHYGRNAPRDPLNINPGLDPDPFRQPPIDWSKITCGTMTEDDKTRVRPFQATKCTGHQHFANTTGGYQ